MFAFETNPRPRDDDIDPVTATGCCLIHIFSGDIGTGTLSVGRFLGLFWSEFDFNGSSFEQT